MLVNKVRRNVQINFRALAQATSNGNVTAYTLSSLLHSGHSIVTGTAHVQSLLVDPATIILNTNPQMLLAIAQ